MTARVGRRAATDPAWMGGGSYLVARRIRIHIEVWDRSSLQDQEQTIGRVPSPTGAPLGRTHEHDAVDFAAKDRRRAAGRSRPTPTSRLANQDRPTTASILLRRGYNFTDGIDPQTGQLDAGLFFLAYQRDPRTAVRPAAAAGSAGTTR